MVPVSQTQQHQCIWASTLTELCAKTHIENTKMKVNAIHNIIRKLANSKWGVQGIDTQTQLCNAHEKQQTPDTNCSITNQLLQIEVAEELNAHSHAAGLVCKQQQTAALERHPDRRASLRQNMNEGDRVFAGWIWRGLALLGNYKPTARMSGSCGNSDADI